MQLAALKTEFSVNSDPGISLASWVSPTRAELSLMHRNDTISNAKSCVVESRLFQIPCIIESVTFKADSQEIPVTNLTRSLKMLC